MKRQRQYEECKDNAEPKRNKENPGFQELFALLKLGHPSMKTFVANHFAPYLLRDDERVRDIICQIIKIDPLKNVQIVLQHAPHLRRLIARRRNALGLDVPIRHLVIAAEKQWVHASKDCHNRTCEFLFQLCMDNLDICREREFLLQHPKFLVPFADVDHDMASTLSELIGTYHPMWVEFVQIIKQID
jgi:hypothetical protein